jgi:hypothetical protein
MTTAQRKAANDETIRTLLDLQKDIGERTESQTEKARKKADTTYRDLRFMVWGVFLFGLGLLIVAIGLFIFEQRTLEVLGLGTLGVLDCIAIFLYKPMDRLQKANADYIQQFTILKGWATTINLQLLAMNVSEPESVITAANNIEKVSIIIAEAFQKFIE